MKRIIEVSLRGKASASPTNLNGARPEGEAVVRAPELERPARPFLPDFVDANKVRKGLGRLLGDKPRSAVGTVGAGS